MLYRLMKKILNIPAVRKAVVDVVELETFERAKHQIFFDGETIVESIR